VIPHCETRRAPVRFQGAESAMSGPIVRKYGFPNFEKIFGDRGLQHGVEDEKAPLAEPAPSGASAPKAEPAQPATEESKKG
jgi:hypothetical protein